MRLSEFIRHNVEPILQAWEDFARTLHPTRLMTVAELRNDAEAMLRFIAADIESSQSEERQRDKSLAGGLQPRPDGESGANDHGLARAVANFSLADLVSEFRALRASIIRLWLERSPPTADHALQLVRFNEAVDQLVAESVVRFSNKVEADSNLFTASVGHDLRNPLNAVVMWSKVLEKSHRLDDNERAAAANIQAAGLRLVGMVNELQDFTRSRLGSPLAYDRAPCDVGAICRAVVDELAAANASANIRLTVEGPLAIQGDRGRIAQAVSNLVANAIQHGVQGNPITVHASGTADGVAVTVHNQGNPIPDVDAMFEPLKRGRPSAGDALGHLGLGLYIARRIASAHGGSVTATSTEHDGTTFKLLLPTEPPSEP